MSNLQVHNSFQPYYAGRDSKTARWTTRKKEGDKVDRLPVDHAGDASGEPSGDGKKT